MNDLSAFDLNQLQQPNNRWEILIQNSDSGGPPPGRIPPARTNHSVITYNEKMYLFGGTNGFQWFNDVWCYDPSMNEWSQMDCIGYIPVPREGHAAAVVDDVMYIFGGRTEEGADLGDLAAFRISSRRWYTFQNMGPSPSPRSGHSMTAVGKAVVIVGGEPSSSPVTSGDLGIAYVLDTTKIRYPPNDSQPAQQTQKMQQPRRPSTTTDTRPPASRDGSSGPAEQKRLMNVSRDPTASQSPPTGYRNSPDMNGPVAAVSKLPRNAGTSSPAGPPPSGPTPAKPSSQQSSLGRVRELSADRAGSAESQSAREGLKEVDTPQLNGRRTPTGPAAVARTGSKSESAAAETPRNNSRQTRAQASVDSITEPALRTVQAQPRPASPPPPTRQPSNPLNRRSSGRNSQTVTLLKELDSTRNRNAWYASELELARKAGYVPNTTPNSLLEGRGTETFDDEDKPLIEALLAMRAELANVQGAVDKQAILAAKQIAEAEKQRDAAIQEAVYAKAKLAAHMGGSVASTPQLDGDQDVDDRSAEVGRKLASALHQQKDLQARIESMKTELEAEKRARQLADDTANASQKRMAELEAYKTQTSTELESLRAELHLVHREGRDQSVQYAEAMAALQLLRVEKDDFQTKYNDSIGNSKEQNDTFDSLREAVAASAEMKLLLERKLDEERTQREKIEGKLNKLKTEHEARTAELVAATQRLRDAEELAEMHANEARTHRQAVLAGFDKITARDVAGPGKSDSGHIEALQAQLTAANALVKKYQQEANLAGDRLRTAEERIAGLEVYQEQSSREGVAIRRQLQGTLKDTQTLQALNSDLKNQLQNQQLETNAVTVQYNTLKDILIERGISPTGVSRTRSINSPRVTSPEQARIRELEEQLSVASNTHEETNQRNAAHLEATEAAYRDKLAQLENDYQSAVHYVKGTEKMLKQLKEQLARYKADNAKLKSEIEDLERAKESSAGSDWDAERSALQQNIDSLQTEVTTTRTQLDGQLQTIRAQLEEAQKVRDEALRTNEEASRSLTFSRRDLEQLHQENAQLEKRAQDAEQKVSLLLDQVESSVDSYRRRSRQVPSVNSDMTVSGPINGNGGAHGHSRQESSDAESAYGSTTGIDARNSTALDNLASELETLRTHWEATNKNYRLSNAFDFDTAAAPVRKEEEGGAGLSESLADWRKRLDVDEQVQSGEPNKGKAGSERP